MSSILPSEYDKYLFREGTNFRTYNILGAHFTEHKGEKGALFSLWAPNAKAVYVVGDFNGWQGDKHLMVKDDASGIWNLFITGIREGEFYKYLIKTKDGKVLFKADPYAFASEQRPGTASKISSLEGYSWGDQGWHEKKRTSNTYSEPMLIYEVHLGSWKKHYDGGFYTYRELAIELVDYVVEMGYTHLELLPLTEYPFDDSWGYQATGYYSVTSRYGTPQDFMYFVDCCHQRGIGVILDWVPGHFCKDDHGLRLFDGDILYEYQCRQKAEHPEWGTLGFDLGKNEVISFLISNAIFWIETYHLDGLRLDAVANMLYLDYARTENQWTPNAFGGNENFEAVNFLKKINEVIFSLFPNIIVVAEESTAWPLVTAPTYAGGLGFNYKWNMGWMNDTLRYIKLDPLLRKYHHNLVNFSFHYAFSENFILPLSHDEVVHGKKSLIDKMPGDYWSKFANLRLYYAYMFTHPGKKLLFMGGEFAQFTEWDNNRQLDWCLLDFEMHNKMQKYVRMLNYYYRESAALWELDHHPEGFEWIDADNKEQSIIIFLRRSKQSNGFLVIVCNFTPAYYQEYHIGVPRRGKYAEVFNSDGEEYGGSGKCNNEIIMTDKRAWHKQPYSIKIKVPPLAAVVFKPLP